MKAINRSARAVDVDSGSYMLFVDFVTLPSSPMSFIAPSGKARRCADAQQAGTGHAAVARYCAITSSSTPRCVCPLIQTMKMFDVTARALVCRRMVPAARLSAAAGTLLCALRGVSACAQISVPFITAPAPDTPTLNRSVLVVHGNRRRQAVQNARYIRNTAVSAQRAAAPASVKKCAMQARYVVRRRRRCAFARCPLPRDLRCSMSIFTPQ